MPEQPPILPKVTDEDIGWVQAVMDLHPFDEGRKAFLRTSTTLDLSACPGSGKTTLIVAKLAIMARKWRHRSKGICVLSHTNAAREEIQRRLGNTPMGQHLLGYPHFIDTIHGFVNRFLALPWLNSKGYPSPTIGDDVTTAYRRSVLSNSEYWTVQSFLARKQKGFDRLRVIDRELRFDLGGKPFPAGSKAKSFQLAKKAVEAAAHAGYFCYDEMFVWAQALLEDFPDVAVWLRRRFPFVMIDEMQDTSELQGDILHAIFPRACADVVVQRIGDPNQAIFEDPGTRPDEKDPFPDSSCCIGISNSYRFGPALAAMASPFAVTEVSREGLRGIGPRPHADAPEECPHAVFIFPDDSTAGVLDAYGRYVLSLFSDEALLNGTIAAVGAVHQDAPKVGPGHQHFPKSVSHYWGGYTAESARKEPHPRTLVQCVRAAQTAVLERGDLYPGVERIAYGLVRLARLLGDARCLKGKAGTPRAVAEALATNADADSAYRRLIKTFLVDRAPLDAAAWRAWNADLLRIARALCEGTIDLAAARSFLTWEAHDPSFASVPSVSPVDAGPNVYRMEDSGRRVDIRLGSIHSVKGQTHLATMVLHTYWYAHSFQKMLPWLLGEQANGNGVTSRDRTRLLQTYVAMTRPSHLLCLAVPRFVFGDAALAGHMGALTARGWQVAEIVGGVTEWRS